MLGVDEEEAAELLQGAVQITWSPADETAACLGMFVITMLARTFSNVGTPADPNICTSWELIINSAQPLAEKAQKLYCTIDAKRFYCGLGVDDFHFVERRPTKILCLLAASFCAAQVTNYVLNLPRGRVSRQGVLINFNEWPGVPLETWEQEADLGALQFAGVGAVGNAITYALQHLPVRGQAALIDPKPVSHGILNRCLWFDENDIGQPKAIVLAEKAGAAASKLVFTPYVKTVQQARTDLGEFNCLVVGVDSRRARRNLQNEMPLEVFDASTTGVTEVVFHHNRQFNGHACMACIYHETEAERTFAHHIAEMLNVTVEDVAEAYISAAASEKICARYGQLVPSTILGKAYDSLFRELCATDKLMTPEQKQVLAPFAFVSQLAGTVLAIELFLRRLQPSRSGNFNYWRVSPWRGIFTDLQQTRAQKSDCEVCAQSDYKWLAQEIWKQK